MVQQIALDTSVLVSALRSKHGAAHRLFLRIESGEFEINLSVPLLLEYEDASKRLVEEIGLTEQEIDDVLNYLVARANRHKVYFLWRPLLPDPKDDMVLELAIAAGCNAIVTFNKRDFREASQFGIKVQTPREFLIDLGDVP